MATEPQHFDLVPFLIMLALLAFVWYEIRRQGRKRNAIRISAPPKFVSWYRAPLSDHVEYLAYMQPTDYQGWQDDGGFFYTRVLANAHRFDTYEAAKKATPVYDGSNNIEGRSGVYTVNG